MKRVFAFVWSMCCFALPVSAQITSGTVSGVVKDSSGNAVSTATITVKFEPTQQVIINRPQTDGRFFISNLRPGGPYTVQVTALGYKPVVKRDITVLLGKTSYENIVLERIALQLSSVQITTDAADDARKQNVDVQVTAEKIQVLPTMTRSLQDMTRLTPEGNGVSFAGSNYRYNNLTIDGAAANDAFGFSQSSGQSTASVPTGTPGSLSRTQPISLDAVEQVSVSIAPYDVKIGNFTGGSVNVVTRSGTNRTEGSVYNFSRPSFFIGNGISGKMPSAYGEYQVGGRIGGPIRQNKLFYFGNIEISRKSDPVLFAPGTAGAMLTLPVAQQISDSMKAFAARSGVAGYDPGTFEAYTIRADNEKYFGRLDWSLGRSIVTLRSNYVHAVAGNLERGQALNKLASQDFDHISKSSSTVAEIKSQLGTGVSNNLLVGLSFVSDRRDPYGSVYAPQIEIQDIQYGQINVGSDREGVIYKQQTRTVELTDNLTWNRGQHTFTVGTHNEFYNIQYTFVNGYAGRWQYPNLSAFFANQPNRIRATYNLTDNSFGYAANTPGANFNIVLPSAYIQDEYALTEQLKVSLGVRVDASIMDTPTQAAAFTNLSLTDGSAPYKTVQNNYGRTLLVAPRVGIVWDKEHIAVRGGAGLFQGRMPFAWYAYPFIHNGLVVGNVDARPTTPVPLIVDPLRQRSVSSTTNYEMNVITNGYVQPQMARGNLAVDFKLPHNTLFVVDGTYTKTLQDILFTNIGLPAPAGKLGGADTRNMYVSTRLPTTATNPYTSVFALQNTSLGYRYNITGTLTTKVYPFDLTAAYSYGQAKDLANGQRNSFQSHVEYNQLVNANEYDLTWSNFDIRHRVVTALVWNWKHTTLSSVYTGASGSPFSYVYSGDLNGDGSSHNDLVYVPRNASEIKLVPSARPAGQPDTRTAEQIWKELDAFIAKDAYLHSRRGQYTERNGGRTPWNHRADVRASQTFGRVQITFDIMNVGNLLNSSWGKFYFVPNLNNQNVYPIQYRSGRAVGGIPSFSFDPVKQTYQTDDLQSRWQMQLGTRIVF